MTTYSPSSHSQKDRSPSLLPAIIVNPAPGAANADTDESRTNPARPASQAEQLAAFLEALAGAVRGDVQTEGPNTPTNRGAPPSPNRSGIGATRPVAGNYRHEQEDPPETFSPALLYHLLSALRNLNHFVFITPGPRGLLFIIHLPRKVIVLILFALFLMFASVYRMPDVWEIMFGIIGIF